MSQLPDQAPGLQRRLASEGQTCDICGGLRYVLPSNIARTDPRYRAYPCPACNPDDHRQRQMDALERQFGQYWMQDSFKLRQFDLAAFTNLPDRLAAGKEEALLEVAAWSRRQSPTPALVLWGISGVGKTCLASAAFTERTRDDVGLAIEYNQLTRAIQAGYRDNSADELIAVLMHVPVLFVDDLGNVGQAHESDDKHRIMIQVIDYRYTRQLPTLITSNLDFDALVDMFSYKLARRLVDASWSKMLHVGGQPLDGGAA